MSFRNDGVNEAKKGEADQISFLANPTEEFRAPHIVDSTPKSLSVPGKSDYRISGGVGLFHLDR